MFRLIVLFAAAIPVALAFTSQNQESATPASTLAKAALAQEETAASLWWADYDADGLEDALAITGAGAPQLLKNLGNGEFTNATQSAGLAGVSGASFAAWGDVDNDGAPDLYVGTATGPKLYVNQKRGTFVEAATRSGLGHTRADRDAHFLDYDHDRQLDLHVQTATGDLLYRGVGAGQFRSVDLGLEGASQLTTAVVADAHEDITTPAASAVSEGDQTKRRGASGGGSSTSRTVGQPVNPVTTRRPAPVLPGGYSSVPCAFVNASASSVFDQTTNQCLLASSMGTLGNLYPLSADFNVDASGNVGIGVVGGSDRLHVRNGDIRVDGSAGREIVVYDGSGQVGLKLDADAAGTSNNIELYKGGAVAHGFQPNGNGYVQHHHNTSGGSAVVSMGNSLDQSGFIDVRSPTGLLTVQLDADVGGTTSTDGRVFVRSGGTGGPGGELALANNDGQVRVRGLGGAAGGDGTLEIYDNVGRRTLLLDGDIGTGGALQMFNEAGIPTIDMLSDFGGGSIEVNDGASIVSTIQLDGNGDSQGGGQVRISADDKTWTVDLIGEAENGGGAVSVQDDLSTETVRIVGDDGNDSGQIRMFDSAGLTFQTTLLEARDSFGSGASWRMFQPNGNVAVDFDGGGSTGSAYFDLREGDGSSMYTFSNNVQLIRNDGGQTTIRHEGNTGAKNAVQITESYGQRLLYSMESPEVWFEDFGSGRMQDGFARVDLDPIFLETVTIDEQNPMKVFITLTGASRGVWVEKHADHFFVHDANGAPSTASFDWRLVAKRRGLENFRLDPFFEPEDPDGDDPTNPVGMRASQDGAERAIETDAPAVDSAVAPSMTSEDDNMASEQAQSADTPKRP